MIKKVPLLNMIKRNGFCFISTSLQTTLSAEEYLRGQLLLEEQTVNIDKPLIYSAVT
jgi:hypothetical protein